MTRYSFDEVRAALDKEWGFKLQRGEASRADGKHDGRWDTTHSRTGFIISGNFPGHGYRHKHYRSLAAIVRGCKLDKSIAEARR